MLDEQDRGAGAHRVGREAMSIGALPAQGNEATARNDVARVNRGGGEGGDPRRAQQTGPGGSHEIVEQD